MAAIGQCASGERQMAHSKMATVGPVSGKRIGLDARELHMRKPGHAYMANGKYANAWGWRPVNAQPSMWSRFDGGGTLWARKGENQQTWAGPCRAGTLSWRWANV